MLFSVYEQEPGFRDWSLHYKNKPKLDTFDTLDNIGRMRYYFELGSHLFLLVKMFSFNTST